MNLELREPPGSTPAPAPAGRSVTVVALAVAALSLGALLVELASARGTRGNAGIAREVGAKLKAAGVLDQAAGQYEAYLAGATEPASERAAIAYSLGAAYHEAGRYGEALRWFYEAETLGPGELAGATASKIVECLERLGKTHAAQSALAARSGLGGPSSVEGSGGDPIVATISGAPIYRSRVLAELDALPPEVAKKLKAEGREAEMVKKVVGDELLLQKAEKLGIRDDPAVARTLATLTRQALIARFLEREVFAKVTVLGSDLENFYNVHRERFGGKTLSEVQVEVERTYRLEKAQAMAEQMVTSELQTQDVKLYPERMADAR